MFIKDESGFNLRKSNLHLHVLHTAENLRDNKLPSPSVALGDTPWLHSSVWPRRAPPPPPFLLYLETTATTNMQTGRRLTHLDYLPPPIRLLLFPLAFLPRLFGVSLITPQLAITLTLPPPSLLSSPKPKHSYYHVSAQGQVVVCCCFGVLFGGQWEVFDL